MNQITSLDQLGREISFSFPPQRIISLVPSQTEYLIDIGAPVVGRTKFCIHPSEKVKHIPIVGGTKNFRFEEIKRLKPDLIIGNKEENYQEGINELTKDFPVWMSDIFTLAGALSMMKSLGQLCDRKESAAQVISQCKKAMQQVKGSRSGSVVYLIWKNPWMAAGSNTFIDHMLDFLGYQNLTSDARYPELSEEKIASLAPNKILLSSEPFPFKEKHLQEAKQLWPHSKIELVDGELFSWYGSRLMHWV